MENSRGSSLTPHSPLFWLFDNLGEKTWPPHEREKGQQAVGAPWGAAPTEGRIWGAQIEGEGFSAPSRSWEPSEQQDLLTLHPQRVKSPSRRGAIWKRFCDRNFSSINP